MAVFTSEITSSEEVSDNPIHQRLFFGYHTAKDYVKGNLLELGCGTGRGLEILLEASDKYTAIDKNDALIAQHSKEYPDATFISEMMPPFSKIPSSSMDWVVTFHVIEHIKDHKKFAEEIHRVLKPGGKALISTPNKNLRLARNPWHVREYTPTELEALLKPKFINIQKKGIAGNEKVMQYYNENKKSVEKITKWDIFNLQYAIPATWLQGPYDRMNRKNRLKLMDNPNTLSNEIHYNDYYISDDAENALDLYFIIEKCDCDE